MRFHTSRDQHFPYRIAYRPPSPPLAGPSGCCKSTTVRVLASVLGFEVVEWAPPTPTTWSEHRYQVSRASMCGWGGDAGLRECPHTI